MSVVMIAGLSYLMVTIVERVGCILGIDSYIMGLVVVAIGTSIPVSVFTLQLFSPSLVMFSAVQVHRT
jgi:Ca2+/Na+ antiporter